MDNNGNQWTTIRGATLFYIYPKGLKLEVGAQGATRLLVGFIFFADDTFLGPTVRFLGAVS